MPPPVPTPTGVIPGKVVQLVAWTRTLLALTDTGEIWVLHGFAANRAVGMSEVPARWRKLSLEADPTLPATTAFF
jgi:hypothetical protein